jgi:hypothetical protein
MINLINWVCDILEIMRRIQGFDYVWLWSLCMYTLFYVVETCSIFGFDKDSGMWEWFAQRMVKGGMY